MALHIRTDNLVCKKHGAVSQSSTEAEVIALDVALRMEGIPALMLWDVVVECLRGAGGDPRQNRNGSGKQGSAHLTQGERDAQYLSDMARHNFLVHSLVRAVDYVPPSMKLSSGVARFFVFEDNEAVIKICIKCRIPNLRHISNPSC